MCNQIVIIKLHHTFVRSENAEEKWRNFSEKLVMSALSVGLVDMNSLTFDSLSETIRTINNPIQHETLVCTFEAIAGYSNYSIRKHFSDMF
jgi:tryptophanyl-tRNA synthetase